MSDSSYNPPYTRTSEKTQVVICFECKGNGYTVTEKLIDYHKREYDYTEAECKHCAGTGRLIEKTVVTYSRLNHM